ncbi:MAG: hypothetical protein K2X47_08470 [Bdellovibrionales bacterium]|nr:hypothetical protein [Bdellovibrionales bacterium]
MMKYLSLILSFLIGHFRGTRPESASYEEMLNVLMERLKGALGALVYGLSGVVFAAGGFLTAYFNVLVRYDESGQFQLGAVAFGGLVLTAVGLILLYVASRQQTLNEGKPRQTQLERPGTSPLEHALSALILDYVKEREAKRENPLASATPPAQSEAPAAK